MQTVSEVMTRDVRFVSPREDVQHAAQMMGELDVGALPVCDGGRLVGMVTDRDITIRSTAAGRSPQEAHVEEVMSKDVRWCFEDQPLDEVMIQMADSQIRRVPVVSHDEQHRLVGIIALGDVATKTAQGSPKADVEQVVEMVSSPTEPAQKRQAGGAGAASGGMRGASGAGAEGGDVSDVYPDQTGAGEVSLADGTGAGQNAGNDAREAGKAPGGMSSAEAAQAVGEGGAGDVSLADGTGAGQRKGGNSGMPDAKVSGPDADQTENSRSGPT